VCDDGYAPPLGSPHGDCVPCAAGIYCASDVRVDCPLHSDNSHVAEGTLLSSRTQCHCDVFYRKTGTFGTTSECEECNSSLICLGGENDEQGTVCGVGARNNITDAVYRQQCMCGVGEYCNSDDSALSCNEPDTCDVCPVRSWCVNNRKYDCPDHSASTMTGLTDPSQCQCDPGYHEIITDESRHCEVCPENFYCYENQIYDCRDLDSNLVTFGTHHPNVQGCICNEGYFRLSGSDKCKPCPWDFYCPIGDDAYLAYMINKLTDRVKSCPDHSHTSVFGSDGLEDCECNAGYKVGAQGACEECPTTELCIGGDDVTDGEPCNGGQIVNADHTQCVCDACFEPGSAAGSACVPCAEPTFKVETGDSECNRCDEASRWVSSTAECEACLAGQLRTESNICACPSPTVLDGGSCEPCGASQYYSEGECVSCSTGSILDLDNPAGPCVECLAGQYADSNICKTCPPGSTSVSGQTECQCVATNTACVGWLWDEKLCTGQCEETPAEKGSCDACIPGTFKAQVSSSGNVETCQACVEGTFQSVSGQSTCHACAANQNTDESSSTQRLDCHCNAGYQREDGSTDGITNSACVPCEAGFFKLSLADTRCEACGQGTFQEATGQTECVDCSERFETEKKHATVATASDLASACVCNAGFTLRDATCVSCVQGSFKTAPGDYACTFCGSTDALSNTYGDGIDYTSQSHCRDCPDPRGFSYIDTEVYNNEAQCECPGGEFPPSGSGNCVVCTEPTQKVGYGNEECSYCANGTYFENIYSPCAQCDLSFDGTTASMHSVSHHFEYGVMIEHGRDRFDCHCNLGFSRKVDGQALSCEPCEAGKFRGNYEDIDSCDECPAGTYQPNTQQTSCEPCPGGSNNASPAGSDSVEDCACLPGQERNQAAGGVPCVDCPAGKVNPTAGEMCVPCGISEYQDQPGMTECSTCGANEVSVDATTAAGCVCKAGFGVGAGDETCAQCESGTYAQQGLTGKIPCVSCPLGKTTGLTIPTEPRTHPSSCTCNAGYGAANPDDGTRCDICASGTYAAGGTNDGCHSCGSNTVSDPGSYMFEHCKCNALDGYLVFY